MVASMATFGSFRDTRLFECMPVAVEVGLLFATRAPAAWFTDGELVRRDTWQEDGGDGSGGRQRSGLSYYAPTCADVHSGEAYRFLRKVETLPALLLVEYRAEFLQRCQQRAQ